LLRPPSLLFVQSEGAVGECVVPCRLASAAEKMENYFWNDPAMLAVGNGKLTVEDGRTQMRLWAKI